MSPSATRSPKRLLRFLTQIRSMCGSGRSAADFLCAASSVRSTITLLRSTLDLAAADTLVPDFERPHQGRRVELRLYWESIDELVELRPLDRGYGLLTLLRRHVQRHAPHRWSRVEIRVIVGQRLLIRLQHIRDEVERHGEPSGVDAGGDGRV